MEPVHLASNWIGRAAAASYCKLCPMFAATILTSAAAIDPSGSGEFVCSFSLIKDWNFGSRPIDLIFSIFAVVRCRNPGRFRL